MAERTIAAMFDAVPIDVDESFITRLRAVVVDELGAETATTPLTPSVGSDDDPSITIPIVGRPKALPRDRRPAWLWIAAVAALLVSVLALTKLVSSLGTPTITVTPSPTTSDPAAGHAYYQPVAGDLEIGTTPIHFSGTITVDSATASRSDPGKALVSAGVEMTLTPDSAAGVVNLRTAYVELYFDNGTVSCVDSGAACVAGALIGASATADPSSISAPSVSLSVTSPLRLVRSADDSITVDLATDLGGAVAVTTHGHLLSGIAVVVVSDSGEVATRIFDRNGLLKVSCAGVPDSCMSSTRSVLPSSETVAPTSTAISAAGGFPPGTVPPGTYSVPLYLAPFTVTTTKDWSGNGSTTGDGGLLLVRLSPVPESIGLGVAGVTITSVPEALASQCTGGSLDTGPAEPATLLGFDAQTVEGTVTADCETTINAIGSDTTYGHLPVGSVMRITAAAIGGRIVIVLATSPASDWATFSKEADATIASMKPTG